MSVGGIGHNRSIDNGGTEPERNVRSDEDAPAVEAPVVRGKSGAWGAGQALNAIAQSALKQLEEAKGDKPAFLGAFDTAKSVESTGRSISRQSGFSSFLGTLTGAGGGRIGMYDAERLIAAAKDFQKITRPEFEALATFINENGGRCEPEARTSLVEFMRKHAPEDIAKGVK